MIFVRVPRTGSTSFLADTGIQEIGPKHATARALRALFPQRWREAHTMGTIRNPWDWLVSVYNSGVSVGAGIKEAWQGPRRSMQDSERVNFPFDEWVRQRQTTPMDWLADGEEIIVNEVRLFEDFIRTAKTHKSGFAHAHYREWYSDDLADYVAGRCRREIEIGNYTF